ncbi:MAG: DUF1818 family protein [Phormidesmis sp.]
MMTRQVRSGEGWRLGWDPHAEQFRGMVAGKDWALELTAIEFKDFCRVAKQLSIAMESMSEQLMDEERLSCEQETEVIWLEAEGLPADYSLRFILLTGRRGEGEWPALAASALIEALGQPPFSGLD